LGERNRKKRRRGAECFQLGGKHPGSDISCEKRKQGIADKQPAAGGCVIQKNTKSVDFCPNVDYEHYRMQGGQESGEEAKKKGSKIV